MPPAETADTLFALQTLDYNVPGGKLNRGMAVLDVLRALKGDQVSYPRHSERRCTNRMLLLLVMYMPMVELLAISQP